MKSSLKSLAPYSKFLLPLLGFGLAIVFNHYVLAYTPPSANPPLGNVQAPLNVGAQDQFKQGGIESFTRFKISRGDEATHPAYLLRDIGGTLHIKCTRSSLPECANDTDLTNTGSRLVIGQDGNVGIGTTAPGFRLDVQGLTVNARIGRIETGSWPASTGYAYFGNENLDHSAVGNYALLQSTTGATFLNAASGQPIAFRINNASYMVLDSSGNVGIGDTSPAALLTVGNGDLFRVTSSGQVLAVPGAAAAPSYAFTTYQNTGMDISGSSLRLITQGSDRLTINSAGGVTIPGVLTVGSCVGCGGGAGVETDPVVATRANTWGSAQTFSGGLTSSGNSNFPGGIWNTSGNVGIGTTSPLSKLSVGGTGNANYQIYTINTPPSGPNIRGGVYAATNSPSETNPVYGVLGYRRQIDVGGFSLVYRYGVYGHGGDILYPLTFDYGVFGDGVTVGVGGSGLTGVSGSGSSVGGFFGTSSVTGYNLKLPARDNTSVGVYLYAEDSLTCPTGTSLGSNSGRTLCIAGY